VNERWADEFGANAAEMRFVRTAVPGKTREAPWRYHGEWRAISIRALPVERTVFDGESTHGSTTSERREAVSLTS